MTDCFSLPIHLLLRLGKGEQSITFSLSVCVSVCLRAYLWNRWTDHHKNLYAGPLWSWLGFPLAALQYLVCFRFYG